MVQTNRLAGACEPLEIHDMVIGYRTALRIAVIVVALNACTDAAPTAVHNRSEPAPASTARLGPTLTSRTIDDEFADLVDALPGFAGVTLDSSGVVNIHLTNVANADVAPQALAVFARRHGMSQLENDIGRSVKVGMASYDFRQLLHWRRALMREIGSFAVTSLDVDERINKVVVGVADNNASQAVLQIAQALAIPNTQSVR